MVKLNKDVRCWSIAAQQIIDKEIKHGMPPGMVEQVREKARRQALVDTYGANWEANLDINGRPQSDGIGSTLWCIRCEERDLERHLQPILKYHGPAAYEAEKTRIMKLRAANKR